MFIKFCCGKQDRWIKGFGKLWSTIKAKLFLFQELFRITSVEILMEIYERPKNLIVSKELP